MSDLTPVGGHRRAALTVAAGVFGAIGWVGTVPPDGELSMAEAVVETRTVGLAVRDQLVGSGLDLRSVSMDITTCEDLGRESQPLVSGGLVQPDGGFSTIADAQRTLTWLVEDGWAPVDSERFDDGIEDRGADRYVVAVTRNGFRMRVAFFTDESYVLFELLGPCLPNTENEQELYSAIGQWDLTDEPAAVDTA
jgi:hypothetical protein